MRHLASLIAGVIVAPVAWVLIGVGQVRMPKALEGDESSFPNFWLPLIVLAAAGLVVGLVAATRISPVGPLAGGLALIGLQAGFLVNPERVANGLADIQRTVLDWFNQSSTGDELVLPLANGTVLAIGFAMLAATASVSRWRRPAAGAPAEEPAVGSAEIPQYGPPGDQMPAYQPYTPEPQTQHLVPQPEYATQGAGTTEPVSPAGEQQDQPSEAAPVAPTPSRSVLDETRGQRIPEPPPAPQQPPAAMPYPPQQQGWPAPPTSPPPPPGMPQPPPASHQPTVTHPGWPSQPPQQQQPPPPPPPQPPVWPTPPAGQNPWSQPPASQPPDSGEVEWPEEQTQRISPEEGDKR